MPPPFGAEASISSQILSFRQNFVRGQVVCFVRAVCPPDNCFVKTKSRKSAANWVRCRRETLLRAVNGKGFAHFFAHFHPLGSPLRGSSAKGGEGVSFEKKCARGQAVCSVKAIYPPDDCFVKTKSAKCRANYVPQRKMAILLAVNFRIRPTPLSPPPTEGVSESPPPPLEGGRGGGRFKKQK